MAIRFEWSEQKNLTNQRKHGVSFEEASEVFFDTDVVFLWDRMVDDEERWHAIGLVSGLVLLLVVHTTRDDGIDPVVGIKAARKAHPKEARIYVGKDR